MIDDAENTEGMVNQVLYRAFTKQHGCNKALLPTGSKVLIVTGSFIYPGRIHNFVRGFRWVTRIKKKKKKKNVSKRAIAVLIEKRFLVTGFQLSFNFALS